MSKVPETLFYTKTHEWVRVEQDKTVTIGITDHAQSELGDLVYVNLPEIQTNFQSGDEAAVIESVKTAADVYAPVSGVITEVNKDLIQEPNKVNEDPYGAGWLFRMKVTDLESLRKLLKADAYRTSIQERE